MRKLIHIVLCVVSSVFFSGAVYAEDITSGYSVSPIFSENQSKEIDSFYDITWTPSTIENFELKITNNSDEQQIYNIEVNKARTNKNGIIDYSDNTNENKTTTYKLTEMIELPKEVTVNAKSSVIVKGTVSFIGEDFNGILMAGIHVSERKSTDSETSISNSVAYNIPFVVRGNIDERPKPILELNSLNIEKFSNEIYTLDLNIMNVGPNLLKEVKFIAEIEDLEGNKIFSQESQIDITPETEFIYPVKLPTNIEKGNYILNLKVEHSKKNTWMFNEKFEITQKNLEKIRKKSYNQEKNKIYFSISIALLFILFFVILMIKRKR